MGQQGYSTQQDRMLVLLVLPVNRFPGLLVLFALVKELVESPSLSHIIVLAKRRHLRFMTLYAQQSSMPDWNSKRSKTLAYTSRAAIPLYITPSVVLFVRS
jgi:small-conductance mechanosensitive channel